jgi:hypothetical protein
MNSRGWVFLVMIHIDAEGERAMTEPDAAPAPRWPWLDRWFEPPWRALLTWVGLATLGGWAYDHGTRYAIMTNADWVFDKLARQLPKPLLLEMRNFSVSCNSYLLYFWMEPLALRLNLRRGLAWFGLRIAPFAVVPAFIGLNVASLTISIVACSTLAALVLHGWRSRPLMALAAGILDCVVIQAFVRFDLGGTWMAALAMTLPYAAILLYGTRRLPR